MKASSNNTGVMTQSIYTLQKKFNNYPD